MDRRMIAGLLDTGEARAVNVRRLEEEVPSCDLVLRTPAGLAFFRIVRPREDVVDVWREAQSAIAAFMDRLSRTRPPEMAYLTLLVEGSADPVQVQRILKNPYVCRKLVLFVDDRTTPADLAARLPFFGLPERMMAALRRPPADPALAVAGTRLSPRFVEEMLSRTGVETIADRLGEYLASGPVSGQDAGRRGGASPSPAGPPPARFRLAELTLAGFRNYGRERVFDLSGDLIVIYGPNGTGKTTLCEAVEWALTGESARVGAFSGAGIDHSVLLSRAADTQEAAVTLKLVADGQELRIRRTLARGAGNASRVWLNGVGAGDRAVLQALTVLAEGDALPKVDRLREPFRAVHFLSQLELEHFLLGTEGTYQAFARMAGTGDLVRLLDKGERLLGELRRRARQAREALNSCREQRDALRRVQVEHKARLQDLGMPTPDPAALGRWAGEVWRRAGELQVAVPPAPDPDATLAWRPAVEALLSAIAARRAELAGAARRLERLLAESASIAALYRRRDALAAAHAAASSRRAGIEQALAEVTDALRRVQAEMAELKAAAEQERAVRERRQRLQALSARREQLVAAARDLEQQLAAAEAEAGRLAQAAAATGAALQEAEARRQRHQAAHEACARRLEVLREVARGLPGWRQTMAERERVARELGELRQRWRQVSDRKAAVQRELEACRARAARLEVELEAARRLAGERQRLVAALRRHLHDDEQQCPLCGHRWPSPAELRTAVAAAGQLIPAALQAAEQAHRAVQEQITALEEQDRELLAALAAIQELGTTLSGRQDELDRELAAAERLVQEALPGAGLPTLTDAAVQAAMVEAEAGEREFRDAVAAAEAAIAALRAEAARTAEELRQQEEAVRRLRADAAQLAAEIRQVEAEVAELAAQLPPAEPGTPPEGTREEKDRAERMAALAAEAGRLEAEARRLATEHRTVLQQLDAVSHERRELAAAIQQVEGELAALAIPAGQEAAVADRLRSRQGEVEAALAGLEQLEGETRRLQVAMAALDLAGQVRAAEEQLARMDAECQRWEHEVNRLAAWEGEVARVLQQARDLRQKWEEEHGELFQPMINVLYQRLSPHPYFGDLEIRPEDGRLHIGFRDGGDQNPVVGYFSQAQQVSVVLSIFLSAALLQGWTRLGTIFIDDPVQHMDDMNVYAFLDLLQGLALAGRQIVVTTASEDLYSTFLGRFGHWQGFRAIRLEGVTREGPHVIVDAPAPAGRK